MSNRAEVRRAASGEGAAKRARRCFANARTRRDQAQRCHLRTVPRGRGDKIPWFPKQIALAQRPKRSRLQSIWVTGQYAGQSSRHELLTSGGCLEGSTFRVLVVDDYESWRSFASRSLRKNPKLQVVSEASDGLEAIQKAQDLQPDLILLDIGLPTVNGIEAARRILQYAPETKILFASQESSSDIVQEALRTGARGYVLKSTAATELLPAVEAVLQGKQFVSVSLTPSPFGDVENERTAHDRCRDDSNVEIVHHHEVGFYSDDRRLLDDVTQFIATALKPGNAAIVAATESHRNSLLPRLQAQGVDIDAAIEQGRYIALDPTDALSTFMTDDTLDPVRFVETFGNLIVTATKATTSEHPRVVIFGECVHLLWAQGNAGAAIQMEKLGNLLTRTYDVDILCGYSVWSAHSEMAPHVFQQIVAQHSAVYSR